MKLLFEIEPKMKVAHGLLCALRAQHLQQNKGQEES